MTFSGFEKKNIFSFVITKMESHAHYLKLIFVDVTFCSCCFFTYSMSRGLIC